MQALQLKLALQIKQVQRLVWAKSCGEGTYESQAKQPLDTQNDADPLCVVIPMNSTESHYYTMLVSVMPNL
jgi:hypothetical protein